MRFLTPKQWQAWCTERAVPLREFGWIRPEISADTFHVAEIRYPDDSGAKVYLARRLFSLLSPEPETLLLIDDWDVWPSSQHLPLFTRFRQAFGEHRSLSEVPAHVVTGSDAEDAVSIIATSLFFVWDCYGISASGRDAFYISHDEYCYFASRDAGLAKRVEAEFAES